MYISSRYSPTNAIFSWLLLKLKLRYKYSFGFSFSFSLTISLCSYILIIFIFSSLSCFAGLFCTLSILKICILFFLSDWAVFIFISLLFIKLLLLIFFILFISISTLIFLNKFKLITLEFPFELTLFRPIKPSFFLCLLSLDFFIPFSSNLLLIIFLLLSFAFFIG